MPGVQMFNCSVFAETGVSRHRALCWLVREAVDRRERGGGSAKGRYKRAYRDAEDALRARGLSFTPLDGGRLDMLIAKPNVELWPAEVETLGLIAEHLVEGLTPAEIAALEARAVERARHQPGAKAPVAAHPHPQASDVWSSVYDGVARERQTMLAELAGEYLIFRTYLRVLAKPMLIVSHMTLTPAPGGEGPGRFRTIGAGSGKDERVVEGLVYEANAAHGVLFSVGREAETGQVRNAMLMPVAKPVPGGALVSGRRDLKGMRLGVSRFSGAPRAYRIWASSVDGLGPDGAGDWRMLAKDYVEGEPLDLFERAVPGFAWIRQWLSRPIFCALEDENDPPTP